MITIIGGLCMGNRLILEQKHTNIENNEKEFFGDLEIVFKEAKLVEAEDNTEDEEALVEKVKEHAQNHLQSISPKSIEQRIHNIVFVLGMLSVGYIAGIIFTLIFLL